MNLIDTFTAAKAAYEIAATAIQARDDVKIQASMSDLREKIWGLSSTGLSQVQALHSLELETQELRMQLADAQREKADLVAKLKEESKYQISQVDPGIWVYSLVETMNLPVQQRANFCAACYSTDKKVPLQYMPATEYRRARLKCNINDQHSLQIGPEISDTPAPEFGHWMD